MTAADREAWKDRARAVSIESELRHRGHWQKLNREGSEFIGPCPVCRGIDRFGANPRKGLWNCRQCKKGGADAISLVKHLDRCNFNEAVTHLAGEPPRSRANGRAAGNGVSRFAGEWIYHNADGTPYLKVKRLNKPNGRKEYPQSHWDNTKWISGKPAGPKIPYRLPELLASDPSEPVYITEGEKCADLVAGLGLTATTASEGAGKWTPELNEHFRDRAVRILLDNDEPGRKHVAKVAGNLNGIAREVRVVELPGLGDKEDVADWITRGGTREQLEELGAAAPLWHPAEDKPAPAIDDDAEIKRLAVLSILEYEREREAAAKKLGISRTTVLDKLVKGERNKGEDDDGKQGHAVEYEEPEPWAEPIDVGELLDDIVKAACRFVILPKHGPEKVALWCAHSYVLGAMDITPRLEICAAILVCGKSTLLDFLEQIVYRADPASNITTAAFFRVVEQFRPTLLIDEVDSFAGEDSDIVNVLNSGHHVRGRVKRTVGDSHEVRAFSTFAALAYAHIGELPRKFATLVSRSIRIEMKRRLPAEKIESLSGPRRRNEFLNLRRRLRRFADDHAATLADADPEMPPNFINRLADNWRLLLAIADLAGGEWSKRARDAISKTEHEMSEREMLLADIRDLFAVKQTDEISSKEMVDALVALEERPWPEMGRSRKPLTQTRLARMLDGFDIHPDRRRYKRTDFLETFKRVLQNENSQHNEALSSSKPREPDASTVVQPKHAPDPPPAGSPDPEAKPGWRLEVEPPR